VHEHYKKKHFPASAFAKPKPAHTASSNASAALPDHAKAPTAQEPAPPAIPATLKQLVNDFSQLQIEPEPPETEFSPQKPCPLAEIPEEILSHILLELAIADVASFARMAQVCKRMAYLVLTGESIWKRVTLGNEYGFAAMHYNFTTNIERHRPPYRPSHPLSDTHSLPNPQTLPLLAPNVPLASSPPLQRLLHQHGKLQPPRRAFQQQPSLGRSCTHSNLFPVPAILPRRDSNLTPHYRRACRRRAPLDERETRPENPSDRPATWRSNERRPQRPMADFGSCFKPNSCTS
jgi:hypothetical protein